MNFTPTFVPKETKWSAIVSIFLFVSYFNVFSFSQGADNCSGAVNMNIGDCTAYTNNENNETPGQTSCGGDQNWSDVWFKFTGNGSTVDLTCTSNYQAVLAIYTSSCPGAMNSNTSCVNVPANGTTATLTLSTVNGTTYYIRIQRTGGNKNDDQTGQLCINSQGVNGCLTATNLPCGTSNLAGTTVGVLQGPVDPASCASRYGKWYSFVGDGNITTISSTASGWDHEMVVYSGSCAALSNISCNDNALTGGTETTTFTTISGVTYYVYIAYWSTTGTTTGAFTISRTCTTPPPAPTNDACSKAISLPCETSFSATTIGAVQGPVDPASCASRYGIWYKFTGDGHVTNINATPNGWDNEMVIYSGSCASLTNVACVDNGGTGTNESYQFIPTNGTTYYVYVANYSTTGTSSNTGPVTITRTCPQVAATGGQVCTAASPFCSGSYLFPNVTGTTAQSGPDYACLYQQPSPVWYYMEISTAGPMVMNVSQSSSTGSGLDIDFAMWGPFTNTTNACTQISSGSALPIQSSYSASSTETIALGAKGGSNSICNHGNGETTPASPAVGQIYVVMLTNYSDNAGYITFSQTGGTGAANCNIVPLSLSTNFSGKTNNNENTLSWEFFGNITDVASFTILRSLDGKKWNIVDKVSPNVEGNSNYRLKDVHFSRDAVNYYKLQTFNISGVGEESEIITLDNRMETPTLVKIVNTMGQEVSESYPGMVIYIYSDGSIVKKINAVK